MKVSHTARHHGLRRIGELAQSSPQARGRPAWLIARTRHAALRIVRPEEPRTRPCRGSRHADALRSGKQAGGGTKAGRMSHRDASRLPGGIPRRRSGNGRAGTGCARQHTGGRAAGPGRIRASQINGCAYCLALHYRDARAQGERQPRLDTLAAWREVPYLFTGRERAALSWCEALTELSCGAHPTPCSPKLRPCSPRKR